MRLIDADALKDTMCTKCANGEIIDDECNGSDCSMLREIENAPTIEAEPVRRGRWIEKPPYSDETVKGLEFQIVCSRCDEQNSSMTFDENSVPIAKTFYRTRYCPNCGAKMYQTGGTISKERFAEIGGADNA